MVSFPVAALAVLLRCANSVDTCEGDGDATSLIQGLGGVRQRSESQPIAVEATTASAALLQAVKNDLKNSGAVPVLIDSSFTNTKCVTAIVPVVCGDDAGHWGNRINTHSAGDTFEITTDGTEVCARRTDSSGGWGMHLEIACFAESDGLPQGYISPRRARYMEERDRRQALRDASGPSDEERAERAAAAVAYQARVQERAERQAQSDARAERFDQSQRDSAADRPERQPRRDALLQAVKNDLKNSEVDTFKAEAAKMHVAHVAYFCHDTDDAWRDIAGDGCQWYADRVAQNVCNRANDWKNSAGVGADAVCCVCKGELAPPPPPPPYTGPSAEERAADSARRAADAAAAELAEHIATGPSDEERAERAAAADRYAQSAARAESFDQSQRDSAADRPERGPPRSRR